MRANAFWIVHTLLMCANFNGICLWWCKCTSGHSKLQEEVNFKNWISRWCCPAVTTLCAAEKLHTHAIKVAKVQLVQCRAWGNCTTSTMPTSAECLLNSNALYNGLLWIIFSSLDKEVWNTKTNFCKSCVRNAHESLMWKTIETTQSCGYPLKSSKSTWSKQSLKQLQL